ncbi:MAG: hypothetical protein KC613_03275, partial [Myxococcales bacterium]|nr:hypothetical protein [Myxococcales bacterium]
MSTFIQRTRALGDAKVPTHIIDALGDRIAQGAELGSVLKHQNTTLTPRILLGIWRAARIHQRHMAHLDEVAEKRRKAGLPAIAPAVLKQTVSAHEVAVLGRAEALAPPGSVAEHRRRDAIKEALALWKACLAIAHKEGELEIKLITDDPALTGEFGDLAEKTSLGELKGHRWMAVRRGVDAGALDLTLEVPVKRLVDQMKARGTELAALARGEKDEELLQKLVLVDLDEWAMALKDEAARSAAYRSAANAYLNLLAEPRPSQPLAAGVYLADGQVGVAVVGREGEWHGGGTAPLGAQPMATVEKLIGNHPVELVVLPTRSKDPEVLNAVLGGFGEHFQVLRVLPNALKAAVAIEGPAPTGGEAAAFAAVLARRALNPLKAWGQLDPIALGLAEYQKDLDEVELRAWMVDMKVLAETGVKPDDLARPAAKPKLPRGPAKPLNPLIKSVDDLRPGLVVNGVVTNI